MNHLTALGEKRALLFAGCVHFVGSYSVPGCYTSGFPPTQIRFRQMRLRKSWRCHTPVSQKRQIAGDNSKRRALKNRRFYGGNLSLCVLVRSMPLKAATRSDAYERLQHSGGRRTSLINVLWEQIKLDDDLKALINSQNLISLESPAEHQENSRRHFSSVGLPLSHYRGPLHEEPRTGGRNRGKGPEASHGAGFVLPDHTTAEGSAGSADCVGEDSADLLRSSNPGRNRFSHNTGGHRARWFG